MPQVEAILATGGKYHYDAPTQSFFVVKGDQWISVEKPDVPSSTSASNGPIGSIASKAYFIQQQGLAGAMFWEVSKPGAIIDTESISSLVYIIVIVTT